MLKLNFTHLGCMIFFSIQLLDQCLDITGVIPAQEIVPKSTLLAQKSSEICHCIVSTSSCTKENERHLLAVLGVDVAKFADLLHDQCGYVNLLYLTISCTFCYAKRILSSIASGNKNGIFQYHIHCTAINASK